MPHHDPIPSRRLRRRPPDPERAAAAWGQFGKTMRWTTAAAFVMVAVSLAWLWSTGPVRLHMMIATALGVGFSVFVAGALMGLIFVSDSSGHDEEAAQGDLYDDDGGR